MGLEILDRLSTGLQCSLPINSMIIPIKKRRDIRRA